MTPLQTAAAVLMDAMVQTDFTCRLGEQLDALEKALEAEQAQAVEPVCKVINGHRGYDTSIIDKALPDGTQLFTHPAPPATPSVTETLAAQGIKLRTEFEPKPREHVPAVEPAGERAELIAALRLLAQISGGKLVTQAADMLESDVSLINEGNKAQQVVTGERAELVANMRSIECRHLKINGKVPLEMLDFYIAATLGLHNAANMLEADAQEIAGWQADQKENLRNQVELQKQINDLKAQQVAAPMTTDELLDLMPANANNMNRSAALAWMARAVERHHGIGAKP